MLLVLDLIVDIEVLFQVLDLQKHLVAFDDRGLLAFGVHRLDEHLGVVLLRLGNEPGGGVFLDDLPAVEDTHPVAEGGHQAQVVGDEENGHAPLQLQFFQ